MNERIEALAKQAGFYEDEGGLYTPYRDDEDISDCLEKFAELLEKEHEAKYFSAGYIAGRSDGIIETAQECINIDYENWDLIEPGVAVQVREIIKQQFGIEE